MLQMLQLPSLAKSAMLVTFPFVWDTLALVDAKFLEFCKAPTTSLSSGWVVFSLLKMHVCLQSPLDTLFWRGSLEALDCLGGNSNLKNFGTMMSGFQAAFSMAGFDRQQACFVSMLVSDQNNTGILLHHPGPKKHKQEKTIKSAGVS